MREHLFPFSNLLIGLLLLMPFTPAWADATQKPAAWLTVDTDIDVLGADSAILTLTLDSRIADAPAIVRLRLPETLQSTTGVTWHGTLSDRQATDLTWTLTGPTESQAPIGIDVTLTLSDGDTLDHHLQAEWSSPNERTMTRSITPGTTLQYRQGETLLVVPLSRGSNR